MSLKVTRTLLICRKKEQKQGGKHYILITKEAQKESLKFKFTQERGGLVRFRSTQQD